MSDRGGRPGRSSASTRRSRRGDAFAGVIISAVFLGALPVAAYYTVGYFCRPWWLLVPVLAALAVGNFFYLFFGLLLVADLVYCPPDAHECPL